MMDFWYRAWWINHAGDLMVPPDPVRPIRRRSKTKRKPGPHPAPSGMVWAWSADLNRFDGRPILVRPYGLNSWMQPYWIDQAAEYRPL